MKRNTVLTFVIVILFVASAGVVYFGIFSTSNKNLTATPESKPQALEVMPYGETLDFTVVTDRKNVEPPYQYKQTVPADVGVQYRDLLRNTSSN